MRAGGCYNSVPQPSNTQSCCIPAVTIHLATAPNDDILVTDAGAGNDLLRVDNQGHVEVLAVFPDELVLTANVKALVRCPADPPDICGLPPERPAQAVPTSVAVGPALITGLAAVVEIP